jgi:glutathione S-transferase
VSSLRGDDDWCCVGCVDGAGDCGSEAEGERGRAFLLFPVSNNADAASPQQDPFRLSYFANTKGRAERIRLLFRLANRTSDLLETHVESSKWPSLKPKTPFGQLPVLRHGTLRLGQSVAIVQYVASQVGLASYSDASTSRMASVALAVEDLLAAVRPHKATKNYEAAREELSKWAGHFDRWLAAGTDEADRKNFVDGKLSYADVIVYDAYEQALNDFLKVDNPAETIRRDFGAPLLAAHFAEIQKQLRSAAKE